MNLSQPLLEVNVFIPHEHYYLWNPELLGLHIVSDAVIVLAYYSMPLTLFYIVRKRRDLPFPWVFLLFSAFIVACGTAHLMEIWTLWHPTYWLTGAIKLITAVISLTTAIALVQIIPKALALPSPAQLDAANQALQAESTERQHMNLALQASEARLAGILEIAEDAIISIAANQQITLFNQGAERIFGYTAAEAIGQPLDLLLPNQLASIHRQHVVDFSQTAGVSRKMGDRREIFGRRKDGTEFPAEASISKLQLGDEVIFTAFLRDITERKQAELAMSRLAAIVESSGDAIIGKSLEGMITSWNRGAERLFGYTAAEVIDRPVAQLFPPNHADELAQVLEQIKQGEFVQSYETVRVRKDGQHVDIAATISPIKDATGRVIGAAKIARDITERKQAENQLRDLSNRLMLALKSGAIGIWEWNVTTNSLTWDNRMYEFYGTTPDQFTHAYDAWTSRLHPDDRPFVEAAIHQALDGEKDYEPEFRVIHPDGTVHYLKAYARVERNPAGIPHRMIGINYDITELKQTAAQIEASLKEKEVLLKEIHHRVKNNLGVVDGLLQMQARRSHNPEVIETLKESHNRIASIALVHEKLYSSDDLAKINIAHYIADLTAHLFDSYNIHANQIKLVSHISDISLAIDTAIPCGLIINELVSNALKYAFSNRQAGEIQVMLDEQPDQSLCLIVRDNGVGLPEDFDPKQATTLGLSLIQGLVKQLRGTWAIHGQSGTTVTITFPRGQS
ncbi:MAG: hypothetical protein DCF22_13265 [Leptolyngbya sp.]|nr:MAG: hypothetical protein DCF22_13265 [Leptolyngbya sp.]